MPLYEYQCRGSKNRFEELALNDRTDVTCRTCGSPDVDRILSTFAVVGQGSRTPEERGHCTACGAAERGMCAMS